MHSKSLPPTLPAGGINSVIEGGYCIGCGACAAAAPGRFQVRFSTKGTFEAGPVQSPVSPLGEKDISTVCPFADSSRNEDELGRGLYSEQAEQAEQAERLGWQSSSWAVRTTKSQTYQRGTSGGIVRWLCAKLLQLGKIDGAVLVCDTKVEGTTHPLKAYAICRTVEEIENVSRSAYYPVTADAVFRQMEAEGGRYVFVGVPCFVKAARLLARENERFRESLVCCIALFCGHQKSAFFGDFMALQLGVRSEDLAALDFRHRTPESKADAVAINVTRRDGSSVTAPYAELFGTDYGHGFFKYKACDFCDDVVGELGDAAVGDAWLPQYLDRGTSIAILRTPFMEELFTNARTTGELWAAPLSCDQVVESQSSNFRHRRDGLRYRLWMKMRANEWAPSKRCVPSATHLTRNQQRVYEERDRVREESFVRWQLRGGSPQFLSKFIREMRPLTLRLRRLTATTRSLRFRLLLMEGLSKIGLYEIFRYVFRRFAGLGRRRQ